MGRGEERHLPMATDFAAEYEDGERFAGGEIGGGQQEGTIEMVGLELFVEENGHARLAEYRQVAKDGAASYFAIDRQRTNVAPFSSLKQAYQFQQSTEPSLFHSDRSTSTDRRRRWSIGSCWRTE